LKQVHRIFGWNIEDLARDQPPRVDKAALGGAHEQSYVDLYLGSGCDAADCGKYFFAIA